MLFLTDVDHVSFEKVKGARQNNLQSATVSLQVVIDLAVLARDILSRTYLIKFTKNPQKRCQKHCMAPDTSFDRLHFSIQQVFAEIRVVW